MRNHLTPPSGFTLFEVAIGLVLTGMVLGGLWVLGSNLFFTQNLNQLEKGIITTATRIRNFYRDRQIKNDNANLNNANLITLNLVAPEIMINGNIADNMAVGGVGNITISYDVAKCTVANSFAMTLASLTKTTCDQLLPRLAGSRDQIQANGIAALFVGNTNELTAVTNNNVTSYNYNPAGVEANCSDGVTVEICFAQ